MKEVFAGAVLAIAMTVAAAAPIAAHHSFAAEFDITRPVTLVGSVTKIEWTNPHAYLFIDVKDPQTGAVTNWEIEMGSPNGLMRNGWTRNTLKIGDTVTVEGSLARDGSPYGNARAVVLAATGKRLFAASSQTEAQ